MSLYVDVHTLRDSLRVRRSEWALAIIMAIGWGYILLLPTETFSAGPSFVAMAAWANEQTWGVACLALGAARLLVLIVNGSWRRCSHARMLLAGLSALVWITISVGVFQAGTVTPGIVGYFVFFVMEIHTVFEAGQDARHADEKRHARAG